MKVKLLPTESQREVLMALLVNRIVVCAAGRRYGKTLLAIMAIIMFAFRKPNSRIIYAAPSYSLAKDVYKEVLNAPGMEHLILANAEQPYPWIKFVNGSICMFLSMDKPNRSRGKKADLLVIDEARDIREADYRSVLAPFVSDTRGMTLAISTFRGKDQWFYKKYETGLSPNGEGVKSFHRPSSEGYCFQGPDGKLELERQRLISGDAAFKVEYLCEAVSSGENCFKGEHIATCTIDRKQTKASAQPCVIGWDLGRVADPSAICIMNAYGQILLTEVFPLKEDYNKQAKRVEEYARAFNALVVVETNGTNRDSIVGLLRPRMPFGVRDVMVRASNKESLVNNVTFALERGMISIPTDCTELLKQLRNYEVKTRGDWLSFSCPDGHDDLVMALCLCQHAIEHNWISRGGGYGMAGSFAH